VNKDEYIIIIPYFIANQVDIKDEN